MFNLTRLTDIQLSFILVNHLSDVSLLDTLMSFAYVRRYASFPLAFHIIVSSNAVRVRYVVLGSPSKNLTYILSLFVETHLHVIIIQYYMIDCQIKFFACGLSVHQFLKKLYIAYAMWLETVVIVFPIRRLTSAEI